MVREIQPTHRSGMGLKAIKQKKKTKVVEREPVD